MTALVWFGVGLLGGLGALGRFAIDAVVSSRAGRQFPVGTLVVNLPGAVALGLLVGLPVTGRALLLAGTAAIGSYTTFSTWMFETHRLSEDGELGPAAVNVGLSLVAGLLAAALGRAIGGAL
ncbi:MAG TPA: fluoride efflux transporter CrcB [Actinomycetes bacterium]|jgi:CrcB protein|nr:fluoride efflux transporter CrcB [Actinomycetes bacterium]